MYKRKTEDEYQIHQHTCQGWEEVSAYQNWKECKVDLKAYRENQPEFPVKMIKRRIKI